MVPPGRFDELPLAPFREAVEINCHGTLHVIGATLPAMRRQGSGRIVMIASGAALVAFYGYTAYAPSKFAVRGLAEALRSELVPDGIGVSIAYPPDTDTPTLRAEPRCDRRSRAGWPAVHGCSAPTLSPRQFCVASNVAALPSPRVGK